MNARLKRSILSVLVAGLLTAMWAVYLALSYPALDSTTYMRQSAVQGNWKDGWSVVLENDTYRNYIKADRIEEERLGPHGVWVASDAELHVVSKALYDIVSVKVQTPGIMYERSDDLYYLYPSEMEELKQSSLATYRLVLVWERVIIMMIALAVVAYGALCGIKACALTYLSLSQCAVRRA